jgi:hypothetical protein
MTRRDPRHHIFRRHLQRPHDDRREEPRSLAVPLGAKTPEAQIVIAIRADNAAIPIQSAAGTAGDADVTGISRQMTKRCWGHVVAPF